ncbi:MAG TPA: flagellar basal body-associated FliL family protein [Chitinispirillaceae bacterium]|nr:flagellar basal body-associated FliL family protein [Chitinispirillaceae bacterium]
MEEKKKEKEGNEEANKGNEKPVSNGNRIAFIGILAAMIIINAVVAFILVKATSPETQQKKEARVHADSLKKAMETATAMGATTAENPIEAVVNIAGTDGERFLKAAIIFEYDNVAYPELGPELDKRTPKFKNLLIDHLSKLTLMDLTEPDAKDRIRKNLLKLINNTIPAKTGEVREVLFTTYLIQ